MSKRVVHISTVHSWQDPRIFEKECKSLAKNGYEVHIITPDGIDEMVDGVMIHKLQYTIKNRIERYLRASKKIFSQAKRLEPNVIHFHDPELIPEALRSEKEGYKIIYDIHEDNLTAIDRRDYIPSFLKFIAKKIVSFFENRAKKYLYTIIAEEYYEKRFPEAEKVLNYPIIEWSKEIKKTPTQVVDKLLYTGNITKDRGGLIHAEIINFLSNEELSKLVMVGKCEQTFYDSIKKTINVSEQNRLEVIGIDTYISFKDIISHYSKSDWIAALAIFPRTMHYEKKHLTKFFEYMAAGIPIIYSNFNEWVSFLAPLNVGIAVNPYDHKEIISTVRRLKADERLRLEMSENGINAVHNKFKWANEEKKIINYYSKIITL